MKIETPLLPTLTPAVTVRALREPGQAALSRIPRFLARLLAAGALAALLAGWMGLAIPPACAAEPVYTSPNLGSHLTEPRDLQLEDIRVLQESPLPGSRTLLEISANMRNLDVGSWILVNAGPGGQTTYRVLTSFIQGGPASAIGEIVTNSPLTPYISFIVSAPEKDAAVAEVLSGAVLQASATTVSGVIVTAASQLPLEGIVLVSETVLSDGRVLLQFAVSLRNLTGEALDNYLISLVRSAGSVLYTLPRQTLHFDSISPSAVTSPVEPLLLDVDSAQIDPVRTGMLSGQDLKVTGTELWVFNAPPRGIDAATEEAWSFTELTALHDYRMVFTNVTPFLESLLPGELLVEDPILNPMPADSFDSPFDPFDGDDPLLADYLPFLISSVTVLSNRVEVIGQQKALLDVIKSATFAASAKDAYDSPVRDVYNPTLENTYTQEEAMAREILAQQIQSQDPRDGRLADLKGLVGRPWHFNETFLSDKIKVSGQMFFRQSGLQLEIKIRDFQLQRAATRIDAGVVLNMVIEATGAENTSNKLAFEKSKDLLPDILKGVPPVSFSLGGVPVTVRPELSLMAGVEANIPTSLTLPLQSAFNVGMVMGYDRSLVNETNKGFFYEPFTEFIPVRVSDPTVFDEFAAELGAWAEVGVALKIGVGQGASLRAGPTLAVRLGNDFRLAPLDNPWWQFDSGIDLIGKFQMEADFLGLESFQLVDLEQRLHHFNLFHRDAGGPLVAGGGFQAASVVQSSTGIEPLLGRSVRWGRLLAPAGSGTWGGFDKAVLLRLGSTDDLVVAGGVVGTISRFTAKGDLVWGKSLGASATPMRGVALPDGSFTLVGTRFNDLWIANFSEAGDRNWWASFAPTGGMTIQNLVLGANAQGQPEYYLIGHVQRALVTRSDPQVIKLDASGQVLWAQSYDLPAEDDEAHGAVLTADGNVVVSGRTGHPVDPPGVGTPDPGNILKTACALLMKVSSSDGSLLWARNYPSQWGLNFYRVVEAPDGTLFAAGSAGRIVTQTRPSNLFARFKPDGTLINHVTVGEDADWPDELPSGGLTPYDNVQDLVWTPEGLLACGVTGLGTGTAGWVMGLTEELGVRFFSVFDGPKADGLLRVVDAGDGFAVLGNTYSAYPWGTGGLDVPVLMKLPWEGIMRFHPDSTYQSRYLQPRVYKSSADLQFLVFSSVTIPGAPPQSFSSSSGTVPFAVNAVTVSPGGTLPALTALPNFLTYAIEAVDFSQVTDYTSWAAYHQLTGTNTLPTADPDRDGLANYLEAYFGRNPFQAETAPVLTIISGQVNGQPVITIEYDRAPFAGSFDVRVESSEDLRSWSPATDLLPTVVPSDARKEGVRLTATPDRPYRYFRIGAPAP